MPRAGLRIAIILFCLFHMTAVAAYSISESWQIAPLTFARTQSLPWIRGYMLITSQWQQWNLFSPDPLRRVSRYRVQTLAGGAWEESPWIDEGLSYARKAGMTKMLRRLEEQGVNSGSFLQFLAIACKERALPAGTQIRLERLYHVLPTPARPLTIAEWRNSVPDGKTDILAERACP